MTSGFTLIELLTVIAIIAILAAIIFPVFNSLRRQTRLNSTMSQMREIHTALKLYRLDNEKYPAALLGFVQTTDGGFYTGSGQPVPIEQLTYRPLTANQKYMKDKQSFISPDNPNNDATKLTNAVYPQIPDSPLADQPVVFTRMMLNNISKDIRADLGPYLDQPATFYLYDSYDLGPRIDNEGKQVMDSNGQPIMEVHYSLDWTGTTPDPTDPTDRDRWRNQLKYPNAPEDRTVVTWNTYHAAKGGGSMIPVLMLSGTTRPVPISQFLQRGPLNYR